MLVLQNHSGCPGRLHFYFPCNFMNILIGGQDNLLQPLWEPVSQAMGAVLHGLSPPQGRRSHFLSTPPCKGHGLHISRSLTHLLHIGTGGRVTKSRWLVYPITQKTQHRRRRATFVPVVWRNSHARTPCSLTTCCSQRQIVSLGRGAQTGGHGLTLLPQAPAVLWVYFSSSPHPDFAARK